MSYLRQSYPTATKNSRYCATTDYLPQGRILSKCILLFADCRFDNRKNGILYFYLGAAVLPVNRFPIAQWTLPLPCFHCYGKYQALGWASHWQPVYQPWWIPVDRIPAFPKAPSAADLLNVLRRSRCLPFGWRLSSLLLWTAKMRLSTIWAVPFGVDSIFPAMMVRSVIDLGLLVHGHRWR